MQTSTIRRFEVKHVVAVGLALIMFVSIMFYAITTDLDGHGSAVNQPDRTVVSAPGTFNMPADRMRLNFPDAPAATPTPYRPPEDRLKLIGQ